MIPAYIMYSQKIHAEDVEGPDSTNESKEKKDAPSSHHKSHSRARSSLTHTHTLHLFITGREFILSPIDSTQQNLTRWKVRYILYVFFGGGD